jgi:vacuolar-type H+-ATPase subunit F/Vma7
MAVVEFIGDEVSAAGYRLCGVDVHIATEKNVLALLQHACERASMVLLGSSAARSVPEKELDRLLANLQPPVLVVPDVRGRHHIPDIAHRVHSQLGMLE